MGKPWEQTVISYSKMLCRRKEADNKSAKSADRTVLMWKVLRRPHRSHPIAGKIGSSSVTGYLRC